MEKILFLNIGWMEKYSGLANDKIQGGGEYVRKKGYGHEIFNFSAYKGMLYGYAPIRGDINLSRLGADQKDEYINGAKVVWVSTDPTGGSVIVGWYKNATVYREWQERPKGTNHKLKNEYFGYNAKCKSADACLLPVDQRMFNIPRGSRGGIGQSAVWYAGDESGQNLKSEVSEYIRTGLLPKRFFKKKNKKKGNSLGRMSDPIKRKKIESIAIESAVAYYKRLGYDVSSVEKDNRGWDLEAVFLRKKLLIEVKGLSGDLTSFELTPNEYQNSRKNIDSYRIAVVSQALSRKPSLSIFSYSSESGYWENEDSQKLIVEEIKGARFTVI